MRNDDEAPLIRSIVDNPWKVIAATLALVMGVGYFMQFVAPSITFKDMLGADWPGLRDYDFMQSEYTNDDNLLVFVEAKDGDAFDLEILEGVKKLTKALWTAPHSSRVDSVTNFQHSEADGDDLKVGDLVPSTVGLTSADLKRIKAVATTDPLAVNRVANPQGNVLAVNVIFRFPMLDGQEKLVSEAYVQDLVETFRSQHPQTNVYVGGLTALDAAVMRISMKETGLFLGLVLLMVVALLIVLLRTVVPVLASVLVLLFSVMSGLALSGMMGWKLTPFTSSVPMIILIIAVADCVHLIAGFVQRLNSGEDKKVALRRALQLNFKAIVITSVTTAVGFMTLNFSESPSIGALGSQSAFGVMFACLLSLTFLPALLSVLPVKPGRPKALATGRYDGLTDRLYHHRQSILVGSFVLSILLGYCVTLNEFNDRIPTYFAKTLPWRQANDFSEEQFGSAYNFAYSINAGSADAASDPAYLAKVEKFTQYLRGLPTAAYVTSIADTFKRLNRNMHGDDPAYYRLPETRALAAQYLLLYELSLPYGLDLNTQINVDKSATKVLAAFKSMSVKEVMALDTEIRTWLDTNLSDVSYASTGVQIMFANFMSRDTRGLTMGAVYGLVVISFLLIFLIRSLKIGSMSILPNIMPALFAFGVWGLLFGEVGFGLAMVSGMSIGIIVDDTVHFLVKYLHARREMGLSARDAVSYTYESVGPSIVSTTIVLVSGFVLMSIISEFRVNSDMGKMTSIILLFALVFDLVTLPVLLMVFDNTEGPKRSDTIDQGENS